MTSDCPCGNPAVFEECCAPIISKRVKASSAEACMRARYSAFVVGAVDFIMDSHHPETVGQVDREEIANWSTQADWHGLKILDSKEEGGEAQVEFVATYADATKKIHHHHELSHFKKMGQDWLFFDGTPVAKRPQIRETPKVGRNDACPCGSGKKFKKCCA